MKVRLVLIPLVTLIFIGCNDIALAQSQKFHNPTLTIRREDGSITLPFNIAGCVDSDRYENVCGKDARAVIAAKACKLKGYSDWVRYQVTDLGWRNRKDQWVWKETSQGGWFVIDESSFMFTLLECSR